MKLLLAKLWRSINFGSKLQLNIMRLTNDEFIIGVTGIIFNEKDELLLVKHSYRQIKWSLPGGFLKAKEHPIEGLEREIQEETGFMVSIDRQLKLRTDRTTGRIDITYIGTFIGGEFKASEEVTAYGFFSFDSLPILLKDQVVFIDHAINQRKRLKQHHLLPSFKKATVSTIFEKVGKYLT